MSIEVMKQALNALVRVHVADNDCDFLNDSQCNQVTHAVNTLRTAIQQAESEPVAYAAFKAKCDEVFGWVVGLGGYDDAVRAVWDYTHPAPGVPDDVARDAERYRWLRKSLPAGQGSLTVLLDDRCNGAFHKAVFMESLDASIDAAMLAASTAQKGGE